MIYIKYIITSIKVYLHRQFIKLLILKLVFGIDYKIGLKYLKPILSHGQAGFHEFAESLTKGLMELKKKYENNTNYKH